MASHRLVSDRTACMLKQGLNLVAVLYRICSLCIHIQCRFNATSYSLASSSALACWLKYWYFNKPLSAYINVL